MKLKYYLRGIGVGILFSTILLSVAFRVSSEKELSDEEIIKRATTLGMVMQNDDNMNLNDLLEPTNKPETSVSPTEESTNTSAEPTITPTVDITVTPTIEPTLMPGEDTTSTTDNTTVEPTSEPTKIPDKNDEDTKNNQNPDVKNITVEILNGMSSENVASLLKNSGVITDDKAFNRFMRESGYATKINVGEYQIATNSTFEQIADIIVEK